MKHALLPNAAGEASVVSLRHRYVLVVNSKTAGTSLKTIAACVEGERLAARRGRAGGAPAQRTENWLKTPTLADLNERWLREVYLGNSFFRFTTVRHPFARCWSAWLDKVAGQHPEFVQRFGTEDWFPTELVDSEELIRSFSAFCDALQTRPGLFGADRHWAPQHLVLQIGAFPYDFIGKTERFAEVIDRWEAATGIAIWPAARRVGSRNVRGVEMPGAALPERTWRRLTELYAIDLNTFAYTADQGDWVVDDEWDVRASSFLDQLARAEHSRPWSALNSRHWSRLRKDTARLSRLVSLRAPNQP